MKSRFSLRQTTETPRSFIESHIDHETLPWTIHTTESISALGELFALFPSGEKAEYALKALRLQERIDLAEGK